MQRSPPDGLRKRLYFLSLQRGDSLTSGSLSTAVNKPVDGLLENTAEKAAVDLWTRAIERLKARLSRHTFQTYFEPIKPISLQGDELILGHSSKFMIDWVRDNLLDVL